MLKYRQSGFTLVELSIVVIVVGLLVGGILKGQELIYNAHISTYASDYNKYKTAHLAFYDRYAFFAGDMPRATASQRVPGCNAANDCSDVGNFNAHFGDGNVGAMWGYPGQSGVLNSYDQSGIESFLYWKELSLAGFIDNIDNSITLASGVGFANLANSELAYPISRYGGYGGSSGWQNARGQPVWFMFTVYDPNGLPNQTSYRKYLSSQYKGKLFALSKTPLLAGDWGGITFTPAFARDIDQKMDDGRPNTGTVIANSPVPVYCKSSHAPTAQYLVIDRESYELCVLFLTID